ncbi:hypothetical protein [Methylobacterium pseudosasicola]|uniref:hypothetical protein n=1 Tax=Methylobacterium pseudosasicola TaxID=582667 RepID=UPI001114254A|nr:hypothetical protein [Methylobacterium pseudosasicola]
MKRFIPTSSDQDLLYQISAFSHSLDPTQSFMRNRADPESGRVLRCYYGSNAPFSAVPRSHGASFERTLFAGFLVIVCEKDGN